MALEIHADSHLDHGLSKPVIDKILDLFQEKDGFFIETVKIAGAQVPCALYGPLTGDEPVAESEVFYAKRGDRKGESRMVARPLRPTDTVTVIAGPHDGKTCVLFTAFGGPQAPREPFDPGLAGNEAGLQESREFWASHALAQ